MSRTFLILLITLCTVPALAQQKQDTVIVELANSSRVIFTVKDRNDLEILKHYNFHQLFMDIIQKLENNDTTKLSRTDSADVVAADKGNSDWEYNADDNGRKNDDNDEWRNYKNHNRYNYYKGYVRIKTGHWHSRQSFVFDLGVNNYLADGKFPDNDNAPYAIRPFGSWYLATSSIQRARLGNKFFLEWGLGLSWYNFKFQKDNIIVQKDDNGVQFIEDMRDVNFNKSKLTATYIQASFIPVIDFNGNGRKRRIWEGYGDAFRIGLGPYVGYRISSRSKLVYDDGDKEKERNRSNFYLNNLRYGARLQIGYRSTDLFFNYDINELFIAGKGPQLNAFSFGIIF